MTKEVQKEVTTTLKFSTFSDALVLCVFSEPLFEARFPHLFDLYREVFGRIVAGEFNDVNEFESYLNIAFRQYAGDGSQGASPSLEEEVNSLTELCAFRHAALSKFRYIARFGYVESTTQVTHVKPSKF